MNKTKEEMAWDVIKAGIARVDKARDTDKMTEKRNFTQGMNIHIPVIPDLDQKPYDAERPTIQRLKTITERELQSLEEERDRLRSKVIQLLSETELLSSKNREYTEDNRTLRRQLDTVRGMFLRLEEENSQLRRARDHYRPGNLPLFIKKYLKFIIFACHPDRNPGRLEAEEVTKELLKLRGE